MGKLSEEEIQFYITNEPNGDEENLVGYWQANAGSGNILYDHSGNANHGIIYGAEWFGAKPEITSIIDVPNDQGGRVYIDFEASYFDTDSLITRIESYQIERNDGSDNDFWVGVGTYNAYASDIYTIEVPTLITANDSTDGMTEFRIIANMEEGNFSGESAWGYSEDNIFPSTPDGFEGSYNDNSITLSAELFSVDGKARYFIRDSKSSNLAKELGNEVGKLLKEKSKGSYKN